MPMNNYLLQKEGETYFLLRQTVGLTDAGLDDAVEWHSDWERIFCSVSHEIVLEQYRKIAFSGDLVDLETFGEGSYGEGSYGPV